MNTDGHGSSMTDQLPAIAQNELIGPTLVGVYTHDESIGDGMHVCNVYFELDNGLVFIAGYEDGVCRASLPSGAHQLTEDDWSGLQYVIGQNIKLVWMDSTDPYASDCSWLELKNGYYVTTQFSGPVEVGGGGVSCCARENFLETPHLVEVKLPNFVKRSTP